MKIPLRQVQRRDFAFSAIAQRFNKQSREGAREEIS
jgi:hypothetical protein